MLLVMLKINKLLERFTKKKCKRQIKKNLGYKKELTEKVINYMSNGKVMIIYLIVGLMKKKLLYKMSYFPDSYALVKTK